MKHLAVVVAFFLAGCATSPAVKDMLWNSTRVAIPANASDDPSCTDAEFRVGDERGAQCISKITGPRPLIVYLHGCAGFFGNSPYFDLFRNLGYVVAAPNSFVRPGRVADCAIMSDKRYIIAQRLEEAKLIVERSSRWPWVDRSKIVLSGFSEGGISTALYEDNDFVARIVLGWTCQPRSGPGRDAFWDGIRGSRRTPVLAIRGEHDHYYTSDATCEKDVISRPLSRSVILPGAGHDVCPSKETDTLVRGFLDAVLSR